MKPPNFYANSPLGLFGLGLFRRNCDLHGIGLTKIYLKNIIASTSVPDPNPDPSYMILLSSSKNSKKNLDSYCFVTSFGLYIFKKRWKCIFMK
jgi:hypothetical protein